MIARKSLIAVLAATTFLTAGAAFADQAMTASPARSAQEKTLDKDAGKLSADGSKAYADIALARLAIFDGRVVDAKTFAADADTEFEKAKSDHTVFLKAEAAFKTPNGKGDAEQGDTKQAADISSATTSGQDTKGNEAKADPTQAATPKSWLPVDGEMIVNEDYAANPKKRAAVADANKSLAGGDRKGAMQKLKLADVNVDFVLAVVPLDQTITDVHKAAGMVNDGKFYEASQVLRQVQDSTRYDTLDVNGVPQSASGSAPSKTAPATH